MKLIVGLGNPGQNYLMTRHNIGFLCIDALEKAYSAPPFKKEHKSEITKIMIQSEPVLLCKPQTFMNLSGEAVHKVMSYYNLLKEDLLVIHDDIDQEFKSIKIQTSRGHGGHNGIRDIHKHLDSNEYARLKIGVGRPSNPKMDVADYVLQNFSSEESQDLSFLLNDVVDAVEEFVLSGPKGAANKFNKKGS